MNCDLPVLRGGAQTRLVVDSASQKFSHERQVNSRKDAPMIRKLILATAAVMALSAGARPDNTITANQSGINNGSTTTQSGPVATSNTAALTQMGFFNTGSVGQAGGNNTSTSVQQGPSGTPFAAQNVLTVGQDGLNFSGTNSQTSLQ